MPPKEDTVPGLLSKVVRFVKNPTTNWADLDQQDTERESSYSKQMLKEMIERKRRNDFVRKREFDMLRKMRRSEVMAGADPAARPSFFSRITGTRRNGGRCVRRNSFVPSVEPSLATTTSKASSGSPASEASVSARSARFM